MESEEARDEDEERVIVVEKIIVLDEGTRRIAEEEVWVEEGGWDAVEGRKVVLAIVRYVLVEMHQERNLLKATDRFLVYLFWVLGHVCSR